VKIKFGMPEILIVFSCLMYSSSFWFSVTAFCLGVLSRLASFLIEYNEKQERSKHISSEVEKAQKTLSNFLNVVGGKDINGFH
tara:strand:- start:1580 stop:1828 length:249 start_codon:yes stop_codon:yes gene_type:complete